MHDHPKVTSMRCLLVPSLAAILALSVSLGAAETVVTPVIAAQAPAAIDPATPESAVLLPARVLRDNDFKAFFLSLPGDEQDKARTDWAAAQQAAKAAATGQPGAPNPQDGINAVLARLLAPGAVDALLAEAEPQLAQMNPQELSQGLAMTAGFLPMMLGGQQGAAAKDPGNVKRIAALQGLLTDASQWVLTAGLNDKAKLKEALGHLVAGAQALGAKDFSELQALPLEDFLARLSPLIKEVKAALRVYDIEVDAFLASVTATADAPAADAPPGQRTITVSIKAFGKPYSFPLTVERSGQHWILSPSNAAPFKGPAGGGDEAGGPAAPVEIAPAAPAAPVDITPAAPVTP